MPRALTALLALTVLLDAGAPARSGPTDHEVTYDAPVAAPVSDPFRRPATPYGPGNRGLEYATSPGTPVGAAADGIVRFAGRVAGRLWVTVVHRDGVRTTYGPFAGLGPGIAAGVDVDQGETLGTTGAPLLWTARIGPVYVDPAVLLAASGPPRVRLVPHRGPR